MNSHTPSPRLLMISPGRLAVATLVSASLLLSGCTTMQSVPVPVRSGPSIAVQVGDHVEVQTKGGQTLSFKVTQIEPAALAGKNIRVKYKDIAGLQVRKVDKVRTSASAAGVILLVGVVYALSHLSPGFPSAGP